MQRYAVIGYPISHSLSPVLHNWAFTYLGYLNKTYEALAIKKEELASFMQSNSNFFLGFSVTIPLKEEILKFAQKKSSVVQEIKAANTLVKTSKGWFAENTDVYGFLTPLKNLGLKFNSALILGAGGASRAVIYSLKLLKIKEIYITNRTYDKAKKLAQEFHLIPIVWEDRNKVKPELLINTTPLGMKGKLLKETPWPYSFQSIKVAYDLIYTPFWTKFLLAAKKEQALALSGLNMFLYQGLKQFKLFTGQEFPLAKGLLVVKKALGHINL